MARDRETRSSAISARSPASGVQAKARSVATARIASARGGGLEASTNARGPGGAGRVPGHDDALRGEDQMVLQRAAERPQPAVHLLADVVHAVRGVTLDTLPVGAHVGAALPDDL